MGASLLPNILELFLSNPAVGSLMGPAVADMRTAAAMIADMHQRLLRIEAMLCPAAVRASSLLEHEPHE